MIKPRLEFLYNSVSRSLTKSIINVYFDRDTDTGSGVFIPGKVPEIRIRNGIPEDKIFKVWCHEIGHAYQESQRTKPGYRKPTDKEIQLLENHAEQIAEKLIELTADIPEIIDKLVYLGRLDISQFMEGGKNETD